MLDLRALTDQTEEIRTMLSTRGDIKEMGFDEVVSLAKERRQLIQKHDQAKHQQKQLSQGMKQKLSPEERKSLLEKLSGLKQEIQAHDQAKKEVEARIEELGMRFPNLPDQSVPVGKDEEANKLIRKEGEPPQFDFTPQAHWDLGESLGILDFESARKVTGARFVTLRGAGARLSRALMQFMLDLQNERGYEEVLPPFIVNRDSMTASGQLPKFEEDAFRLSKPEDWFLVPTAEVPLVNLHRDEILEAEQLPLRYCGYTPCFRAEAGSAGRDTRGMIRQHQFDKVELVQFTTPETSAEAHEALTRDAEEVLKRLKLPYRVMLLSTGDMGFAAMKTYDIEVWLPGQNAYREISSCSNCGDFQARRAKIRYYPEKGAKARLLHTLNGSGLAIGRTIIAILENYQTQNGEVVIPEVLRPYLGGLAKIEKSA